VDFCCFSDAFFFWAAGRGFVVWLAALCLHLTCKQAGKKIRKVKVAMSIFSLLLFPAQIKATGIECIRN